MNYPQPTSNTTLNPLHTTLNPLPILTSTPSTHYPQPTHHTLPSTHSPLFPQPTPHTTINSQPTPHHSLNPLLTLLSTHSHTTFNTISPLSTLYFPFSTGIPHILANLSQIIFATGQRNNIRKQATNVGTYDIVALLQKL